MKKLVSSVVAAGLLLTASAAQADTRPSATEFSQPVADESDTGGEMKEEILLILLGLGGLLGLLLAAGSSQGNSPR